MNTLTNYQIRKVSDDSLIVISQANEQEPELDAIDEALWDKYLAECQRDNLKPSYSDYVIWRSELDG